MSRRGCDHFIDEVTQTINRMRQEYEMTYAEIIGCLCLLRADMEMEAADDGE